MQFKEALLHVKGFRFIAEHLPLASPAGRRFLYETSFMTDKVQLEEAYRKIEEVVIRGAYREIHLSRLKDIRNTLAHLEAGYVLGDIEWFEIKELALLSIDVRAELNRLSLTVVKVPDLSEVLGLLDPEKTQAPGFYIYDCYNRRLADVRTEMRKTADEHLKHTLREMEIELEDEVRAELTERMKPYAPQLSVAQEAMAELDVLLGKAAFAVRFRLSKPEPADEETCYTHLRHPEVEHQLGDKFQPVDVSIKPCATIITGANMAGKSVLLKSLMLAQYMAQFGFWVAAGRAIVVPVDRIMIAMGDEQDEQRGLSSFAAEMLHIHEMICAVRCGEKILALIDEPARTTNPEEGKAIVSALTEFLNANRTMSMITTHYGGLPVACRRLRVKGFTEDRAGEALSLKNINSFIDYTLTEDEEEHVPHEALRIAEILGVDRELTDKAKLFLKRNDAEK